MVSVPSVHVRNQQRFYIHALAPVLTAAVATASYQQQRQQQQPRDKQQKRRKQNYRLKYTNVCETDDSFHGSMYYRGTVV
jgi:hypothetical protein